MEKFEKRKAYPMEKYIGRFRSEERRVVKEFDSIRK